MNKTYNLKQILFALRKEYLEVEKKLEELENYVMVIGDVDNFFFFINDYLPPGGPKTMNMCIKKKQTIIDKITKELGCANFYNGGSVTWTVPENLKYACYWKRKKVFEFFDIEGFTKSVNDILQSDFIKEMPFKKIPCIEDKFGLEITANGIRSSNGINSFPKKFNYSTFDNLLSIERNQKNITPNYIDDVLNKEFNSEDFNDYYRQVIDNYEEKEIEIIDDFESTRAQLKIIEEPKKLILKPKK